MAVKAKKEEEVFKSLAAGSWENALGKVCYVGACYIYWAPVIDHCQQKQNTRQDTLVFKLSLHVYMYLYILIVRGNGIIV